jgi:hypothetical protein
MHRGRGSWREMVAMRNGIVATRRLAVTGLVGLLVAGGAQAAQAHRTALEVEVISEQASLAPDGRSMTFHITTRCDRKWTVVEARVSATQSQGSGEGSFTPACNRLSTVVSVTVPALHGSFQTGPADVSARLVVQQGSTKQAQDSGLVRVRPSVSVRLADHAVLDGSDAVRIDVTVTCPMVSTGRGGQVRIYDGQVVGMGTFGPTPCDGLAHTLAVRVVTSQGSFQVGSAEAEAFASIEEGGDFFPGGDLRTIQITQA